MKRKHLLNGVAVVAALALSPPVWAQPANPSGELNERMMKFGWRRQQFILSIF